MSQSINYILLDSAKTGTEIVTAKTLNTEFFSLYRGKSEVSLSGVAPYLFSFDPQTEFGKWYMLNGWGNSWGVLVYSEIDLKALVKHFRHFLMVKKEDGEQLYFRFYDPRVLRAFLPSCDRQQLNDFFGLINYFMCEDEDPTNSLVFSLRNGELVVKEIKKEELMNFHPAIKKKKSWLFNF